MQSGQAAVISCVFDGVVHFARWKTISSGWGIN
jgi:hypothetical protein